MAAKYPILPVEYDQAYPIHFSNVTTQNTYSQLSRGLLGRW
jgi:hypothetical protein